MAKTSDISTDSSSSLFSHLPHPNNPQGEPRKIGFELEFASLDISRCANDVAAIFGGTVKRKHSMVYSVNDTDFGDFKIELDAIFAQKIATRLESPITDEEASLDRGNNYQLRKKISEWLSKAASEIIPLEVVSPPLPEQALPKLDKLRKKLHKDNALGTGAGILYGLGMHINPEVHSEEISEILDILRSFILLYPWLREVMQVDLSRRVTSFIDPYPVSFTEKITHPDYSPTLQELMTDYVQDNPTRNRALDMLPLFSHLDSKFFKPLPLPENEKLNSRPTFHYRLPNCELDDPDWTIARDWNFWVKIEELATDKTQLNRMMCSYQHFLENKFFPSYSGWVSTLGDEYGYEL